MRNNAERYQMEILLRAQRKHLEDIDAYPEVLAGLEAQILLVMTNGSAEAEQRIAKYAERYNNTIVQQYADTARRWLAGEVGISPMNDWLE